VRGTTGGDVVVGVVVVVVDVVVELVDDVVLVPLEVLAPLPGGRPTPAVVTVVEGTGPAPERDPNTDDLITRSNTPAITAMTTPSTTRFQTRRCI
jgi:hypothetical protein